MFPDEPLHRPVPVAVPTANRGRLVNRYELQERLSQRHRSAAGAGSTSAVPSRSPVILIQMDWTPPPAATLADGDDPGDSQQVPLDAQHASLDGGPITDSYQDRFQNLPNEWPGLGWEWRLLEKACHPSLPRMLDHFVANEQAYLVEEALTGQAVWDAWEDPQPARPVTNGPAQIVEALHALHGAGTILEGLRPDVVAVTSAGRAVLTDLSDLLPLPLPPNPPIQATPYTAPELVLDSANADCRSDLYSFGAMLYALYVGRRADRDGLRGVRACPSRSCFASPMPIRRWPAS